MRVSKRHHGPLSGRGPGRRRRGDGREAGGVIAPMPHNLTDDARGQGRRGQLLPSAVARRNMHTTILIECHAGIPGGRPQTSGEIADRLNELGHKTQLKGIAWEKGQVQASPGPPEIISVGCL